MIKAWPHAACRFRLPAAAAAALLVSGLTAAAAIPAAHADSLVMQRGDSLFLVDLSGAHPDRKLLTIGSTPGILWKMSPDGRRIAWITRPIPVGPIAGGATTPDSAGLAGRPALAHVSDLSGRHEKKLFDTSSLHDREGNHVGGLNPGGDSDSSGEAVKLDNWEPASLSWSGDSRTLYLSCIATPDALGHAKASFAIDAASGSALVDADDHWRSLAAATDLDARGGVLAGSGMSSAGGVVSPYMPVVVIDLAAGTRTPLYGSASGGATDLPDCAFATDCALSPDTKTIAFVGANKGLWLVDRRTRNYRRLVAGAVRLPRWSADGKQLFFLLSRPTATGVVDTGTAPTVYDLYALTPALPVPAGGFDAPIESLPLRLVLQNVDAFDMLPE